MDMIHFTIGPLNGDSIELQISREGTVRDILMKYVGAFDLSGEKARKCRLIFNATLLRRRKSVRDIGLVTGSHILVHFRSDDEVDSESSEQETAIEVRARKRHAVFARASFFLRETCILHGWRRW